MPPGGGAPGATLSRPMRLRRAAIPLVLILARVPSSAATLSGTVALVSNGKRLPDASNVAVWLEGAPRSGAAAPAAKATRMQQSSKQFQPKLLVVERNATVDFPNLDPIYHNVFSVSGGNRFDLGLYRSGSSKSQKFDETGLVRVYCNIHPQMVGFVLVVDSDFAAVLKPLQQVVQGGHRKTLALLASRIVIRGKVSGRLLGANAAPPVVTDIDE